MERHAFAMKVKDGQMNTIVPDWEKSGKILQHFWTEIK